MSGLINRFDALGRKQIHLGSHGIDMYGILANFSTASNLLLGLTVSLFIMVGHPLEAHWATRAIVLAASFDAIDGKFARRSATKWKHGGEFDTLADMVSFAFAPSFLIMDAFFLVDKTLMVLLVSCYFFAASYRLSRFMMQPTNKYFFGIPTPPAAIFIACWYVVPHPYYPAFALSVAGMAGLMVVSLPYTGMKNIHSLFDKTNFVFTIVLMLLLTYSPNAWMDVLAWVFIANISYYGIFGPYHAKKTLIIDEKPI